MQAIFKDAFDSAACFARDFGGYAKDFGGKAADFGKDVGGKAADFGKDVGARTSALAHKVGPKRAAIGLGILAVAIATPFIIRYVRARRANAALIEADGEAAVPKPRPRAPGEVPAPAEVAQVR